MGLVHAMQSNGPLHQVVFIRLLPDEPFSQERIRPSKVVDPCSTAIAHSSGDTTGRPSASQTLANQPAALPHSACEVGICNIDTKQPLASASRWRAIIRPICVCGRSSRRAHLNCPTAIEECMCASCFVPSAIRANIAIAIADGLSG